MRSAGAPPVDDGQHLGRRAVVGPGVVQRLGALGADVELDAVGGVRLVDQVRAEAVVVVSGSSMISGPSTWTQRCRCACDLVQVGDGADRDE